MAHSKKILVVDDDSEIRDLVGTYLIQKGFGVELAKDGLEAVDKAEKQDFDYIFLDIKMSGLDGVETFKRITKKRPGAQIIIMTGYRTMAEDLLSGALKKQIHSILYKPFRMKDLLGIITK